MPELPATDHQLPIRFLGLRATARELGISHPALLKAAETGRVERQNDGTFDVADCRLRLASNTQPTKSRAARAQRTANADPNRQGILDSSNPSPKAVRDEDRTDLLAGVPPLEGQSTLPAKESTADATRMFERARAQREQLKLEREQGSVVELAPINAFVAGMIVKARDAFCRMPSELCDALAHETDALKIESLLSARINEALAVLSEYKRAA